MICKVTNWFIATIRFSFDACLWIWGTSNLHPVIKTMGHQSPGRESIVLLSEISPYYRISVTNFRRAIIAGPTHIKFPVI